MADKNTRPLPEYFEDRATQEAKNALMPAGIALFGAGVAGLDPEPWGKTVGAGLALANAGYAANHIMNSRAMQNGADMWSNTGLPQTPTERGQPPPGMMRLGGPTDFNTAFAELQSAMQDLNGDGVPDPIATAPQPANAMAAMRGPMTGPERAEEAGMQHIRQNAGVPMGPNAPAPNAMAQYAKGIVSDVVNDPLGALQGMDAFGGLAGPISASRNVFNPASREMIRREARELTESGMRRNLMDDIQSSQRYSQEAAAARASDPDVVLSQTPHWQHQPNVKGSDGRYRFQKLPDEVKAARQRGIEKRAREQRSSDRAKYLNEGSN